MSQENNRVSTDGFRVPNFTAQTLNGYKRRWGFRVFQGEMPVFTTRLRKSYRQWLRADVHARENID
ncbi:hypothetical protein RHMOL_Rhmol08G0201100 [Rhododendron molle]|nr:hypothetical protein RHMOL_Rhmol08G0201100 [Rhododendron molle]